MRQYEFPSLLEPERSPVEVPGFSLREDYITAEEERELLTQVEKGPQETDWKRRIQQYGLGYRGQHGGKPVWVRDFPEWLRPLAERVRQDAAFDRAAENCVINEYVSGQGIAPHTDYPAFGPRIACVSLGADIVMDLIDPTRSFRTSVHIPSRSLWVLSGEARSAWQQGIAPRLSDVMDGVRRPRERRVSITFRTGKTPV